MNAQRSKGNKSSNSNSTFESSSSLTGKGRDDSLDPIIWFDAFEDLSSKASRHAASSGAAGNNGHRGKTRARQNSYTMSDEDDDESDGSQEDDSEEEDDDADLEGGNAWASTSKTKTEDASNGIPSTKMSTSYGCCHISHNNLHFLVPMRRDCKRVLRTLSVTLHSTS